MKRLLTAKIDTYLNSGYDEKSRADHRAGLFWKNLEKGVDKWGEIWYSTKAVCSAGSAAEKVLKNLKKVLDKRDRVWYSIKAVCSAESAAEKKVEKK